MRCKFSLVITLFMATGFTLVGNSSLLAQALPDSVIFTAVSTTSMAGSSGYSLIMMRSSRFLVGVRVPLSIEDPRLIIDSVSTAHSIARTSTGWVVQFSETQRRAHVTVIPTFVGFDVYTFPSLSGELFRVYWRVRPEAAAGTVEVDSCFLEFSIQNGDTVSIGLDAADFYNTAFQKSFVPGTITVDRWVCGRVGGASINDLSNVVYLVSYIFRGGPSPLDASFGDVNCDQGVSVSDAVYLLKYFFSGGSAPCAACP